MNRRSFIGVRFRGSLAVWMIASLVAIAHESAARSVTLAWDANTETDLAGYRLHYGTVSDTYTQVVDVGKTTSVTVSDLADATTYFFVVIAHNNAGLESLPSNEAVSPPVPNQSPVVSLNSPGAETSFTAPANITITANASDSDGTVAKVDFFSGTHKIGEDASPPFAVAWNNVPEGDYQIVAVAHDDKDATTRSAEVTIHVRRLLVNSMRRLADGTVDLTVSGAVGRTAYLFVSDDLETWRPLTSVMNTTGTVVINDPAAATADRRFYRVSAD